MSLSNLYNKSNPFHIDSNIFVKQMLKKNIYSKHNKQFGEKKNVIYTFKGNSSIFL